MAFNFTRSIVFTLPGTGKSPGVQVKAVEVDGAISFTVSVLGSATQAADLRGLFFDFNSAPKLAGLAALGRDVTDFDTDQVIDLGNGANMHGAASPFDVGVEFGTQGLGKGGIQSTTFVLSNPDMPLTLDDIAHVEFGARLTGVGKPGGPRSDSSKLVTLAPAAPDAVDDSYHLFEDGQAGLEAPSTVPAGTVFQVLANDTDADGDTLQITDLAGVSHGTVEIVDGADADTLVGDAVLYTPFEDYSGADDFYYAISDNNGGTDFAHVNVNITAVADVPGLSYEILEGAFVNQLIVRVSTSQTDADSSEYIDRIELSGVPNGVVVSTMVFNPSDEPDQVVHDFVITLPAHADTAFDLGITAVSKETSNGDEQTAVATTPVRYDYTAQNHQETFEATDQNMWSRGGAYSFQDDRFIGVEGNTASSVGSTFSASWNLDYKLGLQSTLYATAGEVDAEVPYSVDVNTLYNKATDWLRFETNQTVDVGGASFSTVSPLLTYTLDLVTQISGWLNFGAEVHIPGTPGTPAVKVAGETIIPAIPGIPGFDFGGSTTLNLPTLNASPNILEFDGDSLNLMGLQGDSEAEWELTDGVSLVAAIPVIETESEAVDGNADGVLDYLVSSGDANFLGIKADVDALITRLLGLPANPFGVEAEFGPVTVGADLMNYEITGWMGVGQSFGMSFGELRGFVEFEDGYQKTFNLNDDFDIHNASSHDADQDGQLEFDLTLTPDVNFYSDLSLVLSLEHVLEFLKAEASVEVPVFDDPKYELGPVWDIEGVLASTAIDLVGLPGFLMNLGSQDVPLHVALQI
ncbi:MAG: hypothetical protein RL323_881 [Pseudomonadota bacterium]